MNEMMSRRTSVAATMIRKEIPKIDDLIDGYYMPGPERKHLSPTKRLISHKNSTWEHKKRVYTGLNRGEYSQTYCISPGKTYVIEA